jgi:hypothetical protein
MKPWQDYEMQARRAIEDRGFTVLDANIVFRANCPNIDAIVFGRRGASYVQIKSSTKPAGADTVVVDGSVWTREQLYESASICKRRSDPPGADGLIFWPEVLVRPRVCWRSVRPPKSMA